MTRTGSILGGVAIATTLIVAHGSAQNRPGSPANSGVSDPNMARPIAAVESVWIEELTWLEVRDALRAGSTTAIVATGGIEQNGPYLVTAKHNVILRATAEAMNSRGAAMRRAARSTALRLAGSRMLARRKKKGRASSSTTRKTSR